MPTLPTLPKRLAKYLSEATPWPRREIMRVFHQGRLSVMRPDGAVLTPQTLAMIIYPEDVVYVDEEVVAPKKPQTFVVLHKPLGVITTTSDPQGRPSLTPWLAELPDGVFPVGRLDRETTGALLLTDDGDLAYMLLKHKFHVLKEYHLCLQGDAPLLGGKLELLREGVDIGDGKGIARAHNIWMCASGDGWSTARLTLDEGRNRQVRRMCRAAQLKLLHLHRTKIGPLSITGLEEGAMRALTQDELDALWTACGGVLLPKQQAVAALAKKWSFMHERGEHDERLYAWLSTHAYAFGVTFDVPLDLKR